jgi:hypothetical protein
MFTSHFYDDKIDDVAVSYLVSEIIIQLGFSASHARSITTPFFLAATLTCALIKLVLSSRSSPNEKLF